MIHGTPFLDAWFWPPTPLLSSLPLSFLCDLIHVVNQTLWSPRHTHGHTRTGHRTGSVSHEEDYKGDECIDNTGRGHR